jgi:NAD(P)-dependent dehydrogenase (short-subunit alcohol dehydrogenase family)
MVDYDFSGRVAFVTGAARGQGQSHALRYARHGASVVATDVVGTTDAPSDDEPEASLTGTVDAVRDAGGTAIGVELDVADEAAVERAVGRALDEFGRIDFLANNAGVAPVSGLLDLTEEAWNETINVDLMGTWLCAKHVGRHMRAREGGGRIINTSSTAGLFAAPGLGHYSAAKHGVIGLTKTLATELAGDGITVNAVCPTAVHTPMTSDIAERMPDDLAEVATYTQPDTLFGDILQPEDVTAAFMWLSSEDARFVTGIALPVAAGATAV